MIFTVIYQRAAENGLATAWTDATDRDAVTKAANDLETALRTNPLEHGEAREGSARVAFHPPLVALFDVNEGDRLVTVREIRYRKR